MSRTHWRGAAGLAIALAWGASAAAATSYEPSNPDGCDLTQPYAVLHQQPFSDAGFAQGFHLVVCDTVPAFGFSSIPDHEVRSITLRNGAVVALTEYPENHPAFPGRLAVVAGDVGDLAPFGLAGNVSSAWFFPAGSRVADPSGLYAVRFDRGGRKWNGMEVLRSLVDTGRVVPSAALRSP